MSKLGRIIENPLDYLRPTWRGTLLFAVLFAIVAASVIIGIEVGLNQPTPQQPANR
jgi:hypothetical protein